MEAVQGAGVAQGAQAGGANPAPQVASSKALRNYGLAFTGSGVQNRGHQRALSRIFVGDEAQQVVRVLCNQDGSLKTEAEVDAWRATNPGSTIFNSDNSVWGNSRFTTLFTRAVQAGNQRLAEQGAEQTPCAETPIEDAHIGCGNCNRCEQPGEEGFHNPAVIQAHTLGLGVL